LSDGGQAILVRRQAEWDGAEAPKEKVSVVAERETYEVIG